MHEAAPACRRSCRRPQESWSEEEKHDRDGEVKVTEKRKAVCVCGGAFTLLMHLKSNAKWRTYKVNFL